MACRVPSGATREANPWRPPRPLRMRGQPIGTGDGPLIITPLVGRTRDHIVAEVQAILPMRPDMLEWRLDFFDAIADVDAVLATVQAIRRACAAVPLLLTRRSAAEGGQAITIDEEAVLALLIRACEAGGIDFVDYEMSSPAPYVARLRAASAAHGVGLVLSFHDFHGTPDADSLVARFAAAEALGADVAKVAVMPHSPGEVLTLLSATWRASQTVGVPLISMSMGSLGALSRIAGWQFGSAATFAMGQHASAPGQIGLQDLRKVLHTLGHAESGN